MTITIIIIINMSFPATKLSLITLIPCPFFVLCDIFLNLVPIMIIYQGFCFTSCYKPFLGILSSFAPTTCLYHHILLLSIYIFISYFVHIHQL